MKKAFYILAILHFFAQNTYSQALTTRNGFVSFFSSAPLEDIRAENNKVRAALNPSSGEILIRMRIEDFQFRKALMQKHFNEEYMESHLYPEAQFSGRIAGFDMKGISTVPLEVVVEGNMTFHGVTREVKEKGTIKMQYEKLICEAVFPISVSDYNVRIPRMLVRNIAETVEITVKLELQ